MNKLLFNGSRRRSAVATIINDIANGAETIVKQSTQAVCGAFEREVVVPNERVALAKAKLKRAGFNIIGTSEPNGSSRRIWFVKGGMAGL
jgi:hypothetical protein